MSVRRRERGNPLSIPYRQVWIATTRFAGLAMTRKPYRVPKTVLRSVLLLSAGPALPVRGMIFTKQSLLCGRKNHFIAEFSPGNAEAFQKMSNPYPPRFYQKRGGQN